MRIVTLHQPWATLMALNAKRIETRGWKTEYRGLVAIHAGKNPEHLHLMHSDPHFKHALRDWVDVPLGQIVAVGNLVDCVVANTAGYRLARDNGEVPFGNYTAGRWAWVFDRIIALEPIPYRGVQGLTHLADARLAKGLTEMHADLAGV